MEYFKKLFDITTDAIFSAWAPLAIGLVLLLGTLEYIRLAESDLTALDKFMESLKIASVGVCFLLMATILFYAPMRAWLDENKKLVTSNKKLDIKARNEKIGIDLNRFQSEAIHLQQLCRGVYLHTMKPGETVDAKFNDWHDRVRDYLAANLPSRTSHFEDVISGIPIAVPHGMSPSNALLWGLIEKYKIKLDDLLKENVIGTMQLSHDIPAVPKK